MTPLYQPLAMTLPFTIFMIIKAYIDTHKIFWFGFVFVIMGVISIQQWISSYRKEKYLKQAIEWIA